jgi:hypothetical protein
VVATGPYQWACATTIRWAKVDSGGGLEDGFPDSVSELPSPKRVGTGDYDVGFGTDISSCAVSVTNNGASQFGGAGGSVDASGTGVTVSTWAYSAADGKPSPVDAPFSVEIICP